MTAHTLHPGFLALHSNRSEWLLQALADWLARNPLGPLEEEVVLVQSNGMAEWLKMELARLGGVCAAVRVELPARFVWRTYRQVLGRTCVPAQSAMDKGPLTWRLMRLLPDLVDQPGFEPVQGFLGLADPLRLFQLSARLADLFDQYQVYRPDWLGQWAQGNDVLSGAGQHTQALAPDQVWQPRLWRALLAELDAEALAAIRPGLHQQVLTRLQGPQATAAPLPRRVVVFGVSQFPLSTLEALAALSSRSQVLLAVPNPCRYHWADIMDGRELLRAQRRRQPARSGHDLAGLELDQMHLHAHPLLAAWGRQTRDFVRLLDEFDDTATQSARFNLPRCDLYDEEAEPGAPMLRQLQNDIRDLRPLAECQPRQRIGHDRSIVFHVAHSAMRELEVLHDQLLDLLAAPPTEHLPALQPRDIVVMVPDINAMAPAIAAVFGQHPRSDARHIPFDIADQGAETGNPVVGALTWLLGLPTGRCRMSELVDLMAVPAVAAAMGLGDDGLAQLTPWMLGAGVRWGLNQDHRSDLDLGDCGEQNSAWFGVRRMLMGYACGAGLLDSPSTDPAGGPPAFADIDPYAEVAGIDAGLAGCLAHLLDELGRWSSLARTSATPAEWAQRGRILLAALFKPDTEADRQTVAALNEALTRWNDACSLAEFSAPVPLAVARQAWLGALEEPQLNRRFRAGGVTFCTLMPMRAIPFEVVCLLGMNEGDYPRRTTRSDFDLMGQPGQARPGDRSRRDDDRQLMLDALLSARRLLYVSWCGQSVRDNSEQPPSVLVDQLRDHVAAVWGRSALTELTTHHPLQPFSRRYFEAGSGLHTHATEWRVQHTAQDGQPPIASHSVPATEARQVSLQQLIAFFKNPVRAFFRHTLNVVFSDHDDGTLDEELFDLSGLEDHGLFRELLQALDLTQGTTSQLTPIHIQQSVQQALRAGRLPMGGVGQRVGQQLASELQLVHQAWHLACMQWPHAEQSHHQIRLPQSDVSLQDWLPLLHRNGAGELACLVLTSERLLDSKGALRPDKLLPYWLTAHLTAAGGQPAGGVVVARDATLQFPPMDPEAAAAHLKVLLSLYAQGMAQPLPLPLKTALAHIHPKGDKAADTYEGGHQMRGEATEPCLARVYPDLDSLTASGEFEQLAPLAYQPLLDWKASRVTVQSHEEAHAALPASTATAGALS